MQSCGEPREREQSLMCSIMRFVKGSWIATGPVVAGLVSEISLNMWCSFHAVGGSVGSGFRRMSRPQEAMLGIVKPRVDHCRVLLQIDRSVQVYPSKRMLRKTTAVRVWAYCAGKGGGNR